jgi:Asp/Glu/hydantoin racemase
MIIEGHDHIDVEGASREVVAAGERLVDRHPEVGAVVVECANMPPYSAALRQALGLPVYDAVSFLHWF